MSAHMVLNGKKVPLTDQQLSELRVGLSSHSMDRRARDLASLRATHAQRILASMVEADPLYQRAVAEMD